MVGIPRSGAVSVVDSTLPLPRSSIAPMSSSTSPGPLDGRVAIVTGASRGIGLATAEKLISQGAMVVVTSRKADAIEAAAASLGDRAVGIAAHAADEEAAQACVRETVSRFGRLDILVNNAGTNPAYGPVVDQEHGKFAKIMDVNVWAPILWTQLAWREWMREHGGAVVNVASLGGLAIGPEIGLYCGSKAALLHLSRQLAYELAPTVRVNALAPGLVRTRLAEALWQEDEQGQADATPMNRIGEPVDIAAAIAFLAGPEASWITGETMVVDGGQLLRTGV
jgi:NAD(P)-dependent dehydrogenase (short-subunit alcohol dehydrogenase family)